ncbi:hypothetical protein ROHU_033470 [Labeo rohita]|uniref:Uncharacterized protein n=1 Tax=Labeo rohita TaxID=84645 RepID=A0A498LIL4_LABRO|nr:hypothetical protein ROHU_033470 [Labeo rohita]
MPFHPCAACDPEMDGAALREMETSTQADIEAQISLPSTPRLIMLGESILGAEKWMLSIEGRVVLQLSDVSDFTSALAVLFGSYYVFNIEYPEEAATTLEFIQRRLDLEHLHPWIPGFLEVFEELVNTLRASLTPVTTPQSASLGVTVSLSSGYQFKVWTTGSKQARESVSSRPPPTCSAETQDPRIPRSLSHLSHNTPQIILTRILITCNY